MMIALAIGFAFDQPTPVSGFRLHRQNGIVSASSLPQPPKQLEIQGSNEGVHFYPLTTYDVVDWDCQPVEIPLAVPEPGLFGALVGGVPGLAARRRSCGRAGHGSSPRRDPVRGCET
ncbi:MAG: hypothetical protein R3E53_18380 [Myxococcota bacterium]